MVLYWKAIVFSLSAVIFSIFLSGTEHNFYVLLTLASASILLMFVLNILNPVMVFLRELVDIGELNTGILSILLKCLGISITGEMAVQVCTDAGNAAMGKTVQLLTSSAILYISIPLFSELLTLLQRILGEV